MNTLSPGSTCRFSTQNLKLIWFISEVVLIKMTEAIEFHDITGRTVSANDEVVYELPETSRDDENEYMKISTLAETAIDPITSKDNPAVNVDRVVVPKPEIDTATLKKVYFFCVIVLIMIIIIFVSIGVLTYTLVSYN